ncbi:MAG TPA: glucoamylase family protein, partial [Rhodothermales bacterium]
MRFSPWKCAVITLLTICSGPPSGSQAQHVLIFDDDDRIGSDYRDASFGFTESGDHLRLLGSSFNKLPVQHDHSYAGENSGLLEYRHGTGRWEMFVAAPGFAGQDLTGMDTLLMYLNGPAEIPAAELPRIGLEDTDNDKSGLIPLGDYLPGLDSDSTTWQRVAVPLDDFQPAGAYTASSMKTVRFADSAPNAETRSIWFDLIAAVSTTTMPPDSPPTALETRAGDRSVILRWDPPDGALGHYVYRTFSGGDALDRVTKSLISASTFTDFDVENGVEYDYLVEPIGVAGQPGPLSGRISALPDVMTDDEFLELVAHTAFDFFWYEANPANGLIKDRSTPTSSSSIASVGFGLTGIPIAIDNGWIDRAAGLERVLTTLQFFWNSPHGPEADATGYRGFYYHFLNMQTGRRAGTTELSTIDTALLLGGVLFVKQYFDGASAEEEEIRALADSIYHRADWPWASPRPPRVGHGWRPESGFIQFDWGGYNEAMILYILALGSPTFPIPEPAWAAWTSGYDWETHYGYTFVRFPPLFGHQYTAAWVDFRGIQDAYMRGRGIDYFENSRRATLANRAYCIANPLGWDGYGPNVWGLTASDGPTGYRARGAPPAQNDDGTIAPTAAGGSIVFTPEESIAALRHMYDEYRTSIWGPYGFRDAFNVEAGWFDTD